MEDKDIPSEVLEILEGFKLYSLFIHSAFEAAVEHAKEVCEKECTTDPWLFANLVRVHVVNSLENHEEELHIPYETLPNSGIRLRIKNRYLRVRKNASEREKANPQWKNIKQPVLPGFDVPGSWMGPDFELRWLLNITRDFDGFEIGFQKSKGKIVKYYPVPQPIHTMNDAFSRKPSPKNEAGKQGVPLTGTISTGNEIWAQDDLPIYGLDESIEEEENTKSGAADVS